MGAAHTVCHTTATAPRQPMAALARGLGAACRISVARLRPAESDVRSMSSTRSKTVGAVRQVRGGAEVGFRGLRYRASYPTEREPPYVPPLFPSGVVQLLASPRVHRLVVGSDDQMRKRHACACACG